MNNMKQKITVLLVGFLLTLGISSCVKDSAPELGSSGNTIIKFNDGPEKAFFYSPFTTVKTVTLFTFRRDANSAADLQKPLEVVLQENPAGVTAYNTANGQAFVTLPSTMFTYVADPSITVATDKISIRFAPGEFSKDVKIALNGSTWADLGVKYAKAYRVFDAGSKQVATAQSTIITLLAIKNKYDGVYKVTGTLVDLLGSRIARGYPKTVELRTTGATQVGVYDYYAMAAYGYPLYVYGSPADGNPRAAFGIGFNFNSSDQITSAWDADDDGFYFTLGTGASNTYSAGVINVQWITDANSSGFPVGRFTVTETYTYQGPRP